MKIDIPYYIKQVLREQREVYVPSIGTFSLRQAPAFFSDNRSQLHPPSLSLEFAESNFGNNSLKQYILDLKTFKESTIDRSLKEFTQSIFNKLINVNSATIEGFGVLRRDEQLNAVTFDCDLDKFTLEYSELYPLSVTPITRIKSTEQIVHTVDTTDISARPDKKGNWWYSILAGVIIGALIVFLLKTCHDKDNSIAPGITEAEVAENIDSSVTDEETRALDSQYQELDNLIEKNSAEDRDDSGSKGKVDEELSELDMSDYEDEAGEQDEQDRKQGVSGVDSSVNDSTEGQNVATDAEDPYKHIKPESGECIIILGSFTKATNITKMMSKVEQEGLMPYTSQYNGLTRVGFKFDCSNIVIDEYLQDVRSRISGKAWYLDPVVTIPYQ